MGDAMRGSDVDGAYHMLLRGTERKKEIESRFWATIKQRLYGVDHEAVHVQKGEADVRDWWIAWRASV